MKPGWSILVGLVLALIGSSAAGDSRHDVSAVQRLTGYLSILAALWFILRGFLTRRLK